LYLNYFAEKIKRDAGCHIYPYKRTSMHIESNAQIILHGDIHLNAQQGYGWIGRTHVLMQEGSKLIVSGCIFMRHGALIKLSKNAVLEFAGNVSANINLTIDCGKSIRIGDDCMIGSHAIIYDSDFHPTCRGVDKQFAIHSTPVVIGDHVWIGTRAMLLKGSNIGSGAIIGSNANVAGNVPCNTLVVANLSRQVLKDVLWARNESQQAIDECFRFVD